MRKTVFISHSHKDADWADWFFEAISGPDVDIFYDGVNSKRSKSRLDGPLSKQLADQIERTDIAVILGSESYMDGVWGHTEYSAFIERLSRKENIKILTFWVGGNLPNPILSAYGTHCLSDKSEESLCLLKEKLAPYLYRNTVKTTSAVELPNKATIAEDFKSFLLILDKHQNQLEKIAPKELRNTAQFGKTSFASIEQDISIRETNFILCKAHYKNEYFICIVDSNVEVDFDRLASQDRDYRKAAKADVADLSEFGFNYNFVHPMVRLINKASIKVVVDLNILYQSLFFPRTLIRIPTAKDSKIDVSISTFIRALDDFHGRQYVKYAYCSSKGWKSDQFYRMVSSVYANTRFAPTPSNSLHVGNVRAALIPYLLAKIGSPVTSFLLRFDDTDTSRLADGAYGLITDDLKWLNLLPKLGKTLKQSSAESQDVYRGILEALKQANFTTIIDGEVHMTLPDENEFYLWLDFINGPQISTSIPWKNRELGESQNLALQRRDGSYYYKFTGAIDDMLLTSHIIRDESQLAGGLTDRQAFIASRIRRAFEIQRQHSSFDSTVADGLTSYISQFVNRARLPFPVMSPPAYFHFGIVTDEHNNPLSKRNNPETIYDIRRTKKILPEALVAQMVSSIIRTDSTWSENWALALENLYSVGLAAFYETISNKMTLERLLPSRRSYQYSLKETKKWERKIICSCTATLLDQMISRSEIFSSDAKEKNIFLRKIWSGNREKLSCWSDVLSISSFYTENGIRQISQRLNSANLDEVERAIFFSKNEKQYYSNVSLLTPSQKERIRSALFDTQQSVSGIRIADLSGFVDLNILKSALQDR